MAEKKFLTIVDQVVTRSRAPGTPKGLAAIIAAMRVDLSRRWSAAELSALTRLSHSQTRRLFASICGRVLADGCNERLRYAQSLIVQNNATLSEIAEACGFLRRLSFQPKIQARGRNLAGRLAPRRVRGRP
jgi:transcriptional regulator GlxA family with amidase domain